MILRHTPYAIIIGIVIGSAGEQCCSGVGLEFRPGLSNETTDNIKYLAGIGARLSLASCMIRNGVAILVRDAFNDKQATDTENTKLHTNEENNTKNADEQDEQDEQEAKQCQTRPRYMSSDYYYRKGLGASLICLGMIALLVNNTCPVPVQVPVNDDQVLD